MKIAFLTDGIAPYVIGGMQKYAFYLTKHLLRQGVFVDLYHVTPPEHQDPPLESLFSEKEQSRLQAYSVPIPSTPYFPGHYLYRSWRHSQAVFEAFDRRADVDFVYVNGFPGWKLLREGRRSGPPVGLNFHGYGMFQPSADAVAGFKKTIFRPAVRDNVRRADVVFSFGGKVRRLVEPLLGSEAAARPCRNGVDASWFVRELPPVHDPRRFLFVGRYERGKGVEELNLALRRLLEEPGLDFHFDFVGPIPERMRVHSDRVRYHGGVRDETVLKGIYRSSDVLVCPSHSEGMPTVILEAMASGVPVIATDVGAVGEMVCEDTGWLLPGPDPDRIRYAMREAIEMPAAVIAAKGRRAARECEDRFEWSVAARAFRAEVEEVLSSGIGRVVGAG